MKNLLLLSFMLFSITSFSQNSRQGQPGKCYAKAYFDSQIYYDLIEVTYPIFIGEEDENIELKSITLTTEPGNTKWEKCSENNTGVIIKSTVWCLVESKGETIQIQVVADTSKTKNFILETFESYENVTIEVPENINIWTEVICGNKLTENLITQIQEALRENNFYKGEITGYVNEELETALFSFQKSKELPFGQFDKTTMEALNITIR